MVRVLPAAVERSLRILEADRLITDRGLPDAMATSIARVVATLNESRAAWALVGAHAIGILTEPRATEDFDFIVEDSKLPQVVRALERDFGELDVIDIGPALRLRAIQVDLIRSTTHPLFRKALDHVRRLDDWRVPAPEALIVLKFLSSVSPWRGAAKRAYDAGDLRALYQAVGKDQLDLELMKELAALVYPGAEVEFEQLIGRIERGEPITI